MKQHEKKTRDNLSAEKWAYQSTPSGILQKNSDGGCYCHACLSKVSKMFTELYRIFSSKVLTKSGFWCIILSYIVMYTHLLSALFPHNANYVDFLFIWLSIPLYKSKPHSFNLSSVLTARSHNIDTGGLNTAVPQDIRQLCNIFFNAVKGACKELAKIMRKDL